MKNTMRLKVSIQNIIPKQDVTMTYLSPTYVIPEVVSRQLQELQRRGNVDFLTLHVEIKPAEHVQGLEVYSWIYEKEGEYAVH